MSENTYDWGSPIPATAEQKEFSIPPVGEYDFIVASVEKTFSQSSGNPMLKVRLELQGADGSVFDNLPLTDNMMWKIVTFFESIGIKKKGEELKLSMGEAADKAVGCEGRLKVKHETYNGKQSAKVDKYLITEAKKAKKAPAASVEDDIDDVPFEID